MSDTYGRLTKVCLNETVKVVLPLTTEPDPYTLEMKELYALITEGKPVKTTAQDAAQDLKIFQMIMKAGTQQYVDLLEEA